jgi:hypothetical protein
MVERATEWLKLGAIAVVVVILLTRVPLIIALAQPEQREMPAGCRAGAAAFERDLRAAPRRVSIQGARITQCMTRSSEPGDVQALSVELLDVAADLARRAQEDPDGPAAAQLGYLIGAVRLGARRTQGIHETMLRRLEQEAAPVEDLRGFRRGERAGRRYG